MRRSTPAAVVMVAAAGILCWVAWSPVSLAWFNTNANAIRAISSIITTVGFVIGALAAYDRFFREEALTPRANLHLEHVFVPSPQGKSRVALNIGIENVGPISLSIKSLDVFARAASGDQEGDEKEAAIKDPGLQGHTVEINSGETHYAYAQFFVTNATPAVTIRIVARGSTGMKWALIRTFRLSNG